jgi:phosphoribosylaminoimidazole-succinocarboxamide synthase
LPSITHIGSGKVRDIFQVDADRLLIVASDRISAYDVVLPQPIPDKGRVLTALSRYWFETLGSICPHHLVSADLSEFELPAGDHSIGSELRGPLSPSPQPTGISDLEGRAMLCRKAEPLAIEFVVRGYLAGSGWREYKQWGSVCGHDLPSGLRESDALPGPLLTPATKAITGHDENITETAAAAIAGAENYATAKRYALELYSAAARLALRRGVIIADTKFEFGVAGGEVILIDEVLTPDSSRFWPADSYAPGAPQPSFDKQYVRDWLDSSGWDHTPPPPDLPADVVAATSRRYTEAYERITGRPWERNAG